MPLRLRVAVPKYPWTDLAYALAPNGRTSAGGGHAVAGHALCDDDARFIEESLEKLVVANARSQQFYGGQAGERIRMIILRCRSGTSRRSTFAATQ
mgnify:CR=1 FL=1